MIVCNGFIRKDKVDFSKIVKGRNGDYLDVSVGFEPSNLGKIVLEIRQKNTGKILGHARVGYNTEKLELGLVGESEINLSRIEWDDKGIWPEGHLVVVLRDKPNERGNTILIHTDQPHRSLDYKKLMLGSGKRNELPKSKKRKRVKR